MINNHGRSAITSLGKIGASAKYEEVIDSLTNDYSLNVLTNSAGVNYRYSKPKKINFSFGGNVARADYVRRDVKTDTSVSYKFINVFPRANLTVMLQGTGNLRLGYFGNTDEPSVEQLQPIKDNTDQLNQKIGNPALRQAFRNRFTLGFDAFKLLSERSFFVYMEYSMASNDFSSNEFIDELGRRLSQPVNVNGNRSSNLYLSYSKKIKKLSMRLGVDMNTNYSRNTNFLNGLKNLTNSVNVGAGPRLMFYKEKI